MASRTDKDYLRNSKGEVTEGSVAAFTTRLNHYTATTKSLSPFGKILYSLRNAVSFFY